MRLNSVEAEKTCLVKGVAYPEGVHYRDIIVTGPPCSGKSSLIQKLGGWPEEGYIDLASYGWWHGRVLAFRPREVHFGIPFHGFDESHTVYSRDWLDAPAGVDYSRIQIPPGRTWFLLGNWRERFVFDFQLPPAEQVYTIRRDRAASGTHPVDRTISLQDVEVQRFAYEMIALHFHRCGMRVIVRTEFAGWPRRVIDTDPEQGYA